MRRLQINNTKSETGTITTVSILKNCKGCFIIYMIISLLTYITYINLYKEIVCQKTQKRTLNSLMSTKEIQNTGGTAQRVRPLPLLD